MKYNFIEARIKPFKSIYAYTILVIYSLKRFGAF
ncbi:hypothetical protein SAMN05421797_1011544 [Maribacter ulvicola]|uniref:Uncharacterized protein n=1 Tax=Maribacter ulvicola TaxID=228959 RepID=A0A1N6S7H4_9FLAO|nr:hypothetical protein SAMN05421797_1011544 [Maribacter ulvicola]